MDYPGYFRKSANLHIKDGHHGTSIIYFHRLYCIDNKLSIVEGGDFHICDPSARNESHVGFIQVEKMGNMHDMD